MGKRKRGDTGPENSRSAGVSQKNPNAIGSLKKTEKLADLSHILEDNYATSRTITVQIVVGTYEKVLHGVTATIAGHTPSGVEKHPNVEFAETFLFSAHRSAIRCLALSPQSSPEKSTKVMLASGSSDQIINLYCLSAQSPPRSKATEPGIPSLGANKIVQNPGNKDLGELQHHGGVINALYFPTRSKLLSAAEDSTIAVTRTRDWTVLSTIKAPIPKAHGRPSGDTAPLGGTPAGVNDFAIHPSMKLMVSVGKGEKCMRLWNLVTGKKAGVLNFERTVLQGVGEGRWASGEGRRVRWNSVGEEFVIAFERGCVVYGIDSKAKCRLLPSPSTKVHQLRYLSLQVDDGDASEFLAMSTEDGRIIFYATHASAEVSKNDEIRLEVELCQPIGQLGGNPESLTGRIKDFEILRPPGSAASLIVTGGSDGAVRIWAVDDYELAITGKEASASASTQENGTAQKTNGAKNTLPSPRQVGKLLGTYEAGNRITCLAAFVMSKSPSGIQSKLGRGGASSFEEEREVEN